MVLARVVACACVAIVVLAPVSRGAAPPAPRLIPPVDGAIGRRFEEPASAYGAGHRGIDYVVASGTPVRAAAPGTVAFAGFVAGTLAVTIEHTGGLVSTYSLLEEVLVGAGDVVSQGHWIGHSGASHASSADGLHFGVKLDGHYVDPARFLGALDVGRAIHLAPLVEVPAGRVGEDAMSQMGTAALASCTDPAELREDPPPPPNDNIAVAIAGISSRTEDATGPELYGSYLSNTFGYPPERTYAFSYRGAAGKRLHQDYERADTYRGLSLAASRLRSLLVRIRREHPGADVDLVAHSQGGVIARSMLQGLAHAWDPALPRVEHLVTLATPHSGAPVADLPRVLDDGLVGGVVVDAVSAAARRGWLPVPDAGAASLQDLRPGSPSLTALAREDVAYGTRVLALAMPHDLLVPADRAGLWHETSRVLQPTGLWGHSSILRSRSGRALAYDFLRDAAPSCLGTWDRVGPLLGRAVSAAYGGLAWLYRSAEDSVLGPGLRPARWLLGGLGRARGG
ncbi:hypothetical protein BH24ACT26_BH24ACT26_19180 [soil metagenome]